MPTSRSRAGSKARSTPSRLPDLGVSLFPSELGWMGLLWSDGLVKRLTFGYDTPEGAIKALDAEATPTVGARSKDRPLVKRLQAYAAGSRDDFADVALDLASLTAFQRKVIQLCRKIPFGAVSSYAELAAKAGSPGAARAVGNVMATNAFPLLVPCHRVLGSGGRLGGYSGPRGLDMKRLLLNREGHAWDA